MLLQAPAGWFRLLGPVFFCDLVRTARQRGFLLVRWLYPAAIFVILLLEAVVWSVLETDGLSQKSAPEFCATFFIFYMLFNVLAVFLLTPAYTAGALVEEKERHTLDALLASDLRDREIVLGTYVARICKLGLIFLAPLPVFSFLQFLGGVEPLLIVAGFVFTAISMCSLAALSLFFSVRAERPRDALAKTYLATIAFVAVLTMLWTALENVPSWKYFPGSTTTLAPVSVGDVVHWMNIGNPVVLWLDVVRGVALGSTIDKLLPELFQNYAAFHGALILCTLVYATFSLRRYALGMNQQPGKSRAQDFSIKGWVRSNWHRLPILSERPMLWKEFFVERVRPRKLWRRLLLGLGIAIILLPPIHVAFFFRGQVFPNEYLRPKELMSLWLRALSAVLGSIALLQTLAAAAGGISGERDKQTLPELLATPLTNRAIFFAKWQSAIFRFGSAWSTLLGLGLIGLWTGCLHPVAIVAFLICWLCFAAFLASLGTWFSVVCRSTRQATAGAFLTFSVILGCAALACYNLAEDRIPTFEAVGLLPPAMLAYLTFTPNEWTQWWAGKVAFRPLPSLLDLGFWCIGSLGLFMAARSRFGVLTGRVEGDAQPEYTPDFSTAPAVPEAVDVPTIWTKHFMLAVSSYGKSLGFLAVGILPVALLVAGHQLRNQRDEERLRSFLAQLDETDPGWNSFTVQQVDKPIAAPSQGPIAGASQNAHAIMLKAESLLPKHWPPKSFFEVVGGDWPDQERLPQATWEKRTEFQQSLEDAVAEAHKLASIDYVDQREAWELHQGHTQSLQNELGHLLTWDALVHLQENRPDNALAACCAIVIMAAAMGEPASNFAIYGYQARQTEVLSALRMMQRTLAMGEATEARLAETQRILAQEDLPHFVRLLHRERARIYWIQTRDQKSRYPREWQSFQEFSNQAALSAVPPRPTVSELLFLTSGSTLETQRGDVLRYLTDCINGSVQFSNVRPGWRFGLHTNLLEFYEQELNQSASLIRLVQCQLRATIVALALERYRLAHGNWPSTLNELSPQYLKSIPVGAYTGKPFIYKRLPDGVVIYTPGASQVDCGGVLMRQIWGVNSDIGVRLWNVPNRRKRPSPTAPVQQR